jgi:hypothetical protein
MSATVINGKTGVLTLPSGVAQRVYAITINTGSELLDDSAYGGAGYRTRTVGLQDLSGSFVAFMTNGVSGSNPFALSGGTTGTLEMLYTTGCSISFTVVIGSVQVTGSYAGQNIVTVTFANAADTAPTVAWT